MTDSDSPAVDFELKERAMDEAPIGITISDPDRADNPLIYVNEAFERLTEYEAETVIGRNCRFLQGPDSSAQAVDELRAGIEAAEPVTVELVNYREDGESFWNEVTVAPLRDETGAVTNYVGFQVDVTQRKQAQLALAAERERLDRLVDRINGLLADVTELLMHGVDRRETERAIVDRIVATDAYSAAWVGEPDLARGELGTSSTAGTDDSIAESGGMTVDLESDSPIVRAYEDRTLTLGTTGDESGFGHDGDDDPFVAVPLVYGDAIYGVLVVVGATDDALDDRELVVLESVGRTIATAINAAQSRRGLTADDVEELRFSIADTTCFPVALADAWGGRFELRGSTSTGDGRLRLFVDAIDASELDPEAVDAPEIEDVASISAVEDDDTQLLEVTLAPGSVVDRLAERGATVHALSAESGVAELTVRVPAETGGRVVLELLEDRYDGVELDAYRELDQRPTSKSEFVAQLESLLTDRQATALQSAYFGGYYDDPRTTSGDELAAAMGVSRPTFHQHLRAAERKLLAAVFD